MESSFDKSLFNFGVNSLPGYSFLLVIFTILTMLVLFLRKKIKSYMGHRQRMIDMSEDYERKRQCRNDLRYHYDWALDRGEKESARNIGKEILKLDSELKEMYEDYQFLKEKGFYPLKKV